MDLFFRESTQSFANETARHGSLSFARLLGAILFSAVLSMPGSLSAQPGALVLESHLGGFINAFEVDGSNLYAAQADVFKIFDLNSDPLSATAFFVLDGEPSALAVADGTAFFALDQRLELVAFDSPGALMSLGGFDAGTTIDGLALIDGHALLALGAGGLAIVDLAEPSNPTLIGTFPADVQGVITRGDHAFLATDIGLIVVDLSDPANPIQVGFLAGPAQQKIELSGDLAFLFGRFGQGLQILSVLDPSNPLLIVDFSDGETFFHLDVDQTKLYAILQGRLAVFDLSDPANPSELGDLAITFTTGLQVLPTGDQLMVAAAGQLRRVDISDPAALAFNGPAESPAFPTDHVQHQGQLLIAAEDGLWRYDITDPAMPLLLEHQPAFPGARIRAEGDLIYMVDNSGILHALEIGIDGVTQELDAFVFHADLNPALSFEVDQNLAFLLGFNRFQIIDLADPSALEAAGHVDLTLAGRDMVVLDGGSIVALGLTNFGPQGELALIDISAPATPSIAGQVALDGRPDATTALGTTVHILSRADDQQGFHIQSVDASTPASPVVLGTQQGVGEPRDLLAMANDGLLAAFASGGDLNGVPPGGQFGARLTKAAAAGGSLRSFEAASVNQRASISIPEPASLSTAPAGESPLVALSGLKLETSQGVLGSKGFYFLTFVPQPQPELTLGAIAAPTLDCPPEPDADLAIAMLSLCASQTSGWDIFSLSLRGLGTGDEKDDIEEAILEFPGGPAMASFSADDGTITFDFENKTLAAGECLPMELFYELTPEARECAQEQTKTFAIEASGADVDAIPFTLPPGVKKPFSLIVTAAVEIACVENETKNIGFPNVQSAIDDPRTDPGDTIGVCPGVFDELVLVNKEDLTLHSKKTADVTFLGIEQEIDCAATGSGVGDRVTIVEDGVRILDFTITGARNGVVVAAKEAEIFANIIGGNSGDGVQTSGFELGTQISLNVIGEQESALIGTPTKRRNGGSGISLTDGSGDKAAGNFLLGNCQHGLQINGFLLHPDLAGAGSPSQILGNIIEGNLFDGIHIERSGMNQIGSAAAADKNLIGGNGGDGIDIGGIGAIGNKILGNRIGTGRDGAANANNANGIFVHGGAEKTEIGAANPGDGCSAACNAIEASFGHGIQVGDEELVGNLTKETKIQGNFIGVNAQGMPSDGEIIGNDIGIYSTNASRTAIGTFDGNLISGNRSHGIFLKKGDPNLNPFLVDASIAQNLIGTTSDGSAVLLDGENEIGNGGSGVVVSGRFVALLEVNTISGNNQQDLNPGGGIVALDTESGSARVEMTLVSNLIGTDRDAEKALGNGSAGVWILRGHASVIDSNVISGNPKGVVYEESVVPPLGRNHTLTFNTIGLDKDQEQKLPNDTGVLLLDSTGVEITFNTIGGNRGDGIKLQGSNAEIGPRRNLITGNGIGAVDIDPDTNLGNDGAGIRLSFATGNFIGFDDLLQPEGNLIRFNQSGIVLESQSNENFVVANEIAHQVLHGVEIRGSSENLIGIPQQDFGNMISENGAANSGNGVSVVLGERAESADGNFIRGNQMRANGRQPIDLGNDGPTANDEAPQNLADEDPGANGLQNFPRLLSFTQNQNALELIGVLITKPGEYTIQVYEIRCPAAGGPPDLLRQLGEYPVTVGDDRLAPIDKILTLESDATIVEVAVTATGEEGTSEVVPCLPAPGLLFSDGFESGEPSAWTDFEGSRP